MKIANLDTFAKADTKFNLKKILADEIQITEVDDIYDGPLSGSCKWMNEDYYFFTFDQVVDGEDKWPRTYVLMKPTKEHSHSLTALRDAYLKRQHQKISFEEYKNIYDKFPLQKIQPSQLVGWFGDDGKTSKFIESYFDWISKILPI